MAGKYTTNFSQYKSDVVCACSQTFSFVARCHFVTLPDRERGHGPHSLVRMLDVIKKEDDECTLLNSRVTTCIRFLYQFNSD